MKVPGSVVKSHLKIGNVFRIEMNQGDGITPHEGDNSRNKYFIILGFGVNDDIYGGVVFNSKINQHIKFELQMLHLPMKCSKYRFLTHDCFVDCSTLKTASFKSLLRGKYMGDIDSEDIECIINTLNESKVVTNMDLSKYDLNRR